MATLKSKLAEAKIRLKGLQVAAPGRRGAPAGHATPGERKIRRAMERFDHLQAQVDNLEARVRSYDVGGPEAPVWKATGDATADPAIEAELDQIKQRLARSHDAGTAREATQA